MKFEYFLYNKNKKTRKYRVNIFSLIVSIFKYIKMLRFYKKNEFKTTTQKIKNQYDKRSKKINRIKNKFSTDELLYVSSRCLRLYRIIGKVFGQSEYCLERSVAFTYALNYLGIPSCLVIGKAKYYLSENFAFHAWVEINGYPANDSFGLKKQWHPVFRLPGEVS